MHPSKALSCNEFHVAWWNGVVVAATEGNNALALVLALVVVGEMRVLIGVIGVVDAACGWPIVSSVASAPELFINPPVIPLPPPPAATALAALNME